METFGGIDILVNNASAINLVGTVDQSMKKYDLMHQINIRGTFMVSKYCLPHLLKSKNPHILNLSPPLSMDPKWFAPHLAYTMAKYGMSMCVLGMAEEFKDQVAVNALWPRTAIATAAVKNLLGGDESIRRSRNTDIMSDSAYIILTSDFRKHTGNFYLVRHALCRMKIYSGNTERLISKNTASSRTPPSRKATSSKTSSSDRIPSNPSYTTTLPRSHRQLLLKIVI